VRPEHCCTGCLDYHAASSEPEEREPEDRPDRPVPRLRREGAERQRDEAEQAGLRSCPRAGADLGGCKRANNRRDHDGAGGVRAERYRVLRRAPPDRTVTESDHDDRIWDCIENASIDQDGVARMARFSVRSRSLSRSVEGDVSLNDCVSAPASTDADGCYLSTSWGSRVRAQ